MYDNVIDVEAKVISVEDPKRASTWNMLWYTLAQVFAMSMGIIGTAVTLMWILGKLNIGHFALYYGPTLIRTVSKFCGVES